MITVPRTSDTVQRRFRPAAAGSTGNHRVMVTVSRAFEDASECHVDTIAMITHGHLSRRICDN